MFDPFRIVVDDRDSLITYTGQWSQYNGAMSEVGNNGDVYLSTQHYTSSTGASLTYPFIGTSIEVYGTVNVSTTVNTTDPDWECYVDGEKRERTNYTEIPQNNYLLCDIDDLSPGEHRLLLNVTSSGRPFWLDSLRYTPARDNAVESPTVQVSNTVFAMDFDKSWVRRGLSKYTQTKGGAYQYAFIGSTIAWYGSLLPYLGNASSEATYSIDGGEPVKFNLSMPAGANLSQFNQKFFWVSDLATRAHTLQVVYQGSEGQLPLTLDYLLIGDFSFTSASSPWASRPELARNVLIAIIVVGSLTGLFLLGLAIFLWIKRRKNLETVEEERKQLLAG
ncbi:hypothetical protein AX16_002432 [Volvariella volvacea WC 439]|nr:hypothetical protein AX16_002432 [Volvariella volvacea WC 439]